MALRQGSGQVLPPGAVGLCHRGALVCFSVVTVTSLCQSQEQMSLAPRISAGAGWGACKLSSQMGP